MTEMEMGCETGLGLVIAGEWGRKPVGAERARHSGAWGVWLLLWLSVVGRWLRCGAGAAFRLWAAIAAKRQSNCQNGGAGHVILGYT